MMDFEEIKNIDSQYYMPVFNRANVCFTHGEGCKLYDINNKEYTDFGAGIAVSCLGHNDPDLVNAISEQAKDIIHLSNLYYSPVQAKCAKELIEGSDFDKVFFCNSGAEANEGAIKLVRKYYYNKGVKKPVIITAKNSFHGRTLTTTAATGQSKYSAPYAPLPEKFVYVPFNDIEALKDAVTDEVGAIMLEVIQGEGGVIIADKEYIKQTAQICKDNGILLIIDEVQTGMGRTGKMFGYEHYGIVPDIITLAKGLGGGVPIGAVLARNDVANAFSKGDHGTTFGGNPLACSASLIVLKKLKNGLIEHTQDIGTYFLEKLKTLKEHSAVKDVRGLGLLIGLELESWINSKDIIDNMLSNCYIIIGCGNNTLRFCPPLIINKKQIDDMVDCLDSVLSLNKEVK